MQASARVGPLTAFFRLWGVRSLRDERGVTKEPSGGKHTLEISHINSVCGIFCPTRLPVYALAALTCSPFNDCNILKQQLCTILTGIYGLFTYLSLTFGLGDPF